MFPVAASSKKQQAKLTLRQGHIWRSRSNISPASSNSTSHGSASMPAASQAVSTGDAARSCLAHASSGLQNPHRQAGGGSSTLVALPGRTGMAAPAHPDSSGQSPDNRSIPMEVDTSPTPPDNTHSSAGQGQISQLIEIAVCCSVQLHIASDGSVYAQASAEAAVQVRRG